MRAADTVITVVDFECTGAVQGYADEPWQVGWVCIRQGAVAPDSAWESLIRVGPRPFNPYAPGRHRERRADIERAPEWSALWPRLEQALTGRPLAAHNTPTERRMLERAAPLHRFGPWIDTLKLARRLWPACSSFALDDVLECSGLGDRVKRLLPGYAPHDALYDAMGSALILETALHMPGWESVSVEALEDL